MNDRIRELAEQCYQIEDPHGRFPREVFNQEKFAELIIAMLIAASDIEEHFGVEE